MGFLDFLFGSEPETTTIDTTGPRTDEGQKLWDQFMGVYGPGGAFDPSKQSQQYAGWQNQVYNSQPLNVNVPGAGSFQVMNPYYRQKTNAINNTMGASYSPFVNATMQLEQLRKGTMQPVTEQGTAGLVGNLAPAVALMGMSPSGSPFANLANSWLKLGGGATNPTSQFAAGTIGGYSMPSYYDF